MIIIPENIKALIFDLDGTLVDTMSIHLESWVKVGKEYDVNITEDLINQHLGTPTTDLVNIFNKNFKWNLDATKVRKSKQKYFDEIKQLQGKIKPVEHIFAIAKAMKGKMPMSIGTGSSRSNAMSSLEDIGAADWWVTIITGSDKVLGKPNPDIFLACAKAMDTKPEDCLVFEDGPSGIQSAISAGMQYIDITKI